jgi:GNAT superfamily N-acetyltransferase
MPADVDLTKAADRNFLGSYRKLADHIPEGEIREFGDVFAFATGLPIGIFNGCIVTAPAPAEDVEVAVRWVDGHEVPYRLWIHEELIGPLVQATRRWGMDQDPWTAPEMVLEDLAEPPSLPPGVTVRAVSDAKSLDVYRGVFVEGGMSEDVARRLFAASFAADPDVELVVAYLDDCPVGTSLAIRTGDVAGVYAVGTLPDARRRGIGTAATWAAIAASRAWGCREIVLQSSEMGFPMYGQMGFRTVVSYAVFRPSG